MAKAKVKQVTEGINKGKWGVYEGKTLMVTFSTKGAATADANRRNK